MRRAPSSLGRRGFQPHLYPVPRATTVLHPGPGTQVLQNPLRSFWKPPSPSLVPVLCLLGSSPTELVCACTLAHVCMLRNASCRAWHPSDPCFAHGPTGSLVSPRGCFGGFALSQQPKLAADGFPSWFQRPRLRSTKGLLPPQRFGTTSPVPQGRGAGALFLNLKKKF